MKIRTASIQFNEYGTPTAQDFDDVYFSNDDGAAETRYVFIQGNQLLQRFFHCTRSAFVIGETGFGTGLNCALAIETFNQFRRENPEHTLKRLNIVSVEKFPLSKADLEKTLLAHPAPPEFKQTLLNQYPSEIAGCHRIEIGEAVIDLWLGDAVEMFSDMTHFLLNKVDAWFLDGFAPSKNPDMWSQDLFNIMGRLSAPNATLATFTAAGFVRRGLIAAGFLMRKHPGFGRKRDMLIGDYSSKTVDVSYLNKNIETKRNKNKTIKHVGVIGVGLAGANTALSLVKRGCSVTLFDSQNIASGASGNPQGGFYPQLHAQTSYPSLIQALSFDYAKRRYLELLTRGEQFEHDFCGVLQLAFSDGVTERQQKMLVNAPWPDSLIYPVTEQQASTIAGLQLGLGGVFIPQGGWISPPSLVSALLSLAKKIGDVQLFKHNQIDLLKDKGNQIQICANNLTYEFDHVVIAGGAATDTLQPCKFLPFGKTRGQVESIPTKPNIQKLQTVLCHKGYFTPTMAGRHALGSTYARHDESIDYREADTQTNFQTHKKALPNAPFISTLTHDFTGRASTRMTLPDHQPVVGILHDKVLADKVSVLSGLGSRGLTTSPLMAEILVSELFDEPMPIQTKLYNAVHCLRFNDV